MSAYSEQAALQVVGDVADFDRQSGSVLEWVVFNHRLPVLLFFALATLVLGYFALKLQVNASFERMIPMSSPCIQNYFKYHPQTGQPLNYGELSRTLEDQIRKFQGPRTGVYIVGFAKIVGDLIAGLNVVMQFFGVSVVAAALFVFAYTRCVRSTLLLVAAAIAGVVWLLGLMQLLGYQLDPYSILVPFLVFAIGLSHGVQRMNGILQDVGRGQSMDCLPIPGRP